MILQYFYKKVTERFVRQTRGESNMKKKAERDATKTQNILTLEPLGEYSPVSNLI